MPGDISRSHKGTPDHAPYAPSWCYPDGKPNVCPCGHHEGYHNSKGECLNRATCGCTGLPMQLLTDLA